MLSASCESTIALLSHVFISSPVGGRSAYLKQYVLVGKDTQEDVFKLDITFRSPS